MTIVCINHLKRYVQRDIQKVTLMIYSSPPSLRSMLEAKTFFPVNINRRFKYKSYAFQPLTIFTKCFIVDDWQGSEYIYMECFILKNLKGHTQAVLY